MSFGRLKWILGVLAVVAAVAVMVWQRRDTRRWSNEIAVLQEELREAAAVRETNELLIARLKREVHQAETERRELVRLRAQGTRLQQAEQENARLRGERDRLAQQIKAAAAAEVGEPPATPEAQLLLAKLHFARNLGLGLLVIADENDGRLPAEMPRALAEVIEMLSPGSAEVHASQFELVYKGSLREVKQPSDTILAREKAPFQQADGKWGKTYVFVDGSARRLVAETPEALALREKELSGEQKP